jgi:hypothetical protein
LDILTTWVDGLDPAKLSTADGLLAFRLLAPTLDSLVTLQAKIAEQRVAEARDVIPQKEAQPKIGETAVDCCAAGSTTIRSRRQPEHWPHSAPGSNRGPAD